MEKEFSLFCLLVSLMSASLVISSESREDRLPLRGKRQTEAASYIYYQQPQYPKDCEEVYVQCEEQTADGVYLIKPEGSPEPFEVYCNNSIDGGGWTVLQRRVDGSVEFYRHWNDYKNGFGFLRGEFWLGNDKISYLTNQKMYELRIDLNNVNGEPYYAKYDLFRISDEGSKYRLVDLGEYDSNSTASFDAFASSRNHSFSTRDQENDVTPNRHCAIFTDGAWWYGPGSYLFPCGHSMFNNLYNAGSVDYKSIRWYNLPGNLYHIKFTEMKIRPLPVS